MLSTTIITSLIKIEDTHIAQADLCQTNPPKVKHLRWNGCAISTWYLRSTYSIKRVCLLMAHSMGRVLGEVPGIA